MPTDPILNAFAASTEAGCNFMKNGLSQRREETREAKHRCDWCKKESSEKPLQACQRCRAARYCGRQCQVAHFSASHKTDCANFKDPPLCQAWAANTYLPGCSYPERPVFSKAHKEGMGCWVSIGGSIDCTLTIKPGDFACSLPELENNPEEVMNQLPGLTGNFLEIEILIQNRIKAKEAPPRLVMIRGIMAVGSTHGSAILMEGKQPNEPHMMLPGPTSQKLFAMIPVWAKLTHFNGKEVKNNTHPNLFNQEYCATVLHSGDYLICKLQFRVGGPHIDYDFDALENFSHFVIPSVPHDPSFTGPWEKIHSMAFQRGTLIQLNAFVDQDAVRDWYKDYKKEGKTAYIASHYGEARANMIDMSTIMMGHTMELMMEKAMQNLFTGQRS